MAIIATALLAFATGGCVDPLDDSLKPQPEEPTLTFWIRVPGSMVTTKAETGYVDGIQYESTLHDVQVWVFPHGVAEDKVATTLPLNYVEKDLDVIAPDQWDTHTTTSEETLDTKWGKAYKIQVPVPKEFVLASDPRVDIYVLANWRSIFSTTNKPAGGLSLAQVQDLVFGASTLTNAYFGTTTPTTAVPPKGLPISTIYMGEDGDDDDTDPDGVSLQFLQDAYNGTGEPLTNDLFKRKLGVIELERAVSKVRFAFARTVGLKDVEITKIEIGKVENTQTEEETSPVLVCTEGIIPQQTYVFPHVGSESDPCPLPNGYTGAAVATIGSDADPLFKVLANPTEENPQNPAKDISEVSDPEKLRGDSPKNLVEEGAAPSSMSAQQYDTYLNTYVTSSKTVYFRETGVRVSGLIHYKVGNETKTKDFKMEVFDNNYNNLHRNHYWIVYAYFRGGSLWIKPVLVQDWDDAAQANYSVDGTALIAISDETQSLFGYGWTTSNQNTWYKPNAVPAQKTEWYFRRQELNDQNQYDWSDWVNSQVVIAPGRDPYSGAPLYANKIELRTNYLVDLKLKCDNPAFGFVVYDSNSQFSEILDEVVITRNAAAGDPDKSTFFYLVPKEGSVPSNPIARVSLVTTGNQPVKLPFNAGVFPGSEENSEIFFYYVTETEFKSYYTTPTENPHPPVNIRAYSESETDYTNQLWPSE